VNFLSAVSEELTELRRGTPKLMQQLSEADEAVKILQEEIQQVTEANELLKNKQPQPLVTELRHFLKVRDIVVPEEYAMSTESIWAYTLRHVGLSAETPRNRSCKGS